MNLKSWTFQKEREERERREAEKRRMEVRMNNETIH